MKFIDYLFLFNFKTVGSSHLSDDKDITVGSEIQNGIIIYPFSIVGFQMDVPSYLL